MAAVTPTSVIRHNFGSLTATVAAFAATTDDADTWASGIPGIVAIIATQEDTAGTQAATGAGASNSGSTITIHLGEDNSAVKLVVLSES
jgi:hypothetical protein